MNNEDVVRAVYPRAQHRRYRDYAGEAYYLIWSDGFERGDRLAEGATAKAAWAAAARRVQEMKS